MNGLPHSSFLRPFFFLFLFLAPTSKLFYVTNYTNISFFTWSVIEKQNNTVNFNLVFWGSSAVPVFRSVPVFRCSGVLRCSGVPGFSTCHKNEKRKISMHPS